MNKTLDDIVYHMYESSGTSKYVLAGRKPLHPDEAKKQIKTLMLTLIGDDEKGYTDYRGENRPNEENAYQTERNQLRAELRKRLEAL